MSRTTYIFTVAVLIVIAVTVALAAPALGERCFGSHASAHFLQAESISDGAGHVAWRILDTETGVVCFVTPGLIECMEYE